MGTNSTPITGIGRMILRAILPAAAAIIAASIMPLPAVCGDTPSPVIESSRTYKDPVCNFMVKNLENEIAETTTSLKDCGNQSSAPVKATAKSKKCAQYERKLRLTKANLLNVKEQCDKGLTPDSLPKVADDPDVAVPCSQCGADKLLPKDLPAKVLTGLPIGGNVMDLKAGDPNLGTVFGKSVAAPAAVAAEVPPVGEPYVDCKCPDNTDLGWMYLSECTAKRTTSCGTVQPPIVQPPIEPPTTGQPPIIQPPTEPPTMGRPSSKGFWTKVGSVLKAIGKWIWDNIIKPIADFFVGIYHKIKGETEKCGENWYNPATTCCTDGNKSDDMFSDKNTTLDSCPNRVQKNNDQTKLPNGCSVPVMVWPVLVIKYGAFTPDNPVSSSPDTSFRPACDRHDICYGTCNNNKNDVGYRAGCDEPFGANMFAVCNRQVDLNRRNRCRELAGEYVGRTMQFGEGNYTKAQRKECKCCP